MVTADNYWQLFEKTGSIAVYMEYRKFFLQ